MKELILSVLKLNKTDRLLRLCEIGGKEIAGTVSPMEYIEMNMIQAIREQNGELDEMRKEREVNPL